MPNETLPPVTDLRSAAAHIEGLLDLGDAPTPSRQAAPEPISNEPIESSDADEAELDAAPDESSASLDDESDNEPADDESPAIEPPKSWNADEQAKFRELSPELQEVVSRRESERDRAISTKLNQVANERKAIEQTAQNAQAVQTHYAQTLNQLLTLTYPELQQIEQTDFLKLANTDPAEAVRLNAVRDNLRQRVGFMQQQIAQANAQANAQMQTRQQAFLADQYERLIDQVPDFREPDKARALVSSIGDTMKDFGFTPEEIASVADARIVRVMAKLARYESNAKARQSAQGKKAAVAAPVMAPKAASPVKETNVNKKMGEQWQTLRKSQSARDAARLIENIL